MSPGDILYTDGIDDGSQEHRELEAGMSEHWPLSAKDICDALLDFAVSRGDYLLRAGKEDQVDDKTVFIIKKA